MGTMLILIVTGALYFVPTIIVFARKHHQGLAIFVLNLIAGWTVLGWVVALVWACTAVRVPRPAGEQA